MSCGVVVMMVMCVLFNHVLPRKAGGLVVGLLYLYYDIEMLLFKLKGSAIIEVVLLVLLLYVGHDALHSHIMISYYCCCYYYCNENDYST